MESKLMQTIQTAEGRRHVPLASLTSLEEILSQNSVGNDLLQSRASIRGGFLDAGRLAWRACATTLEVMNTANGLRKAAWTFNGLHTGSSKVTCVCGLGLKVINHVVIGLSLICDQKPQGLVAVLCLQSSKIIRAFHVPYAVTSLCVINGLESQLDPATLSPILQSFGGILAVGTTQGDLYVVDLALDVSDAMAASDDVSPGTLHLITSQDVIQRRLLFVKDKFLLAIYLSERAHVGSQFHLISPTNEPIASWHSELVEVSALLFVPQLASLAVGYNFGSFQLFNLHTMQIDCANPPEEKYDEFPPVMTFAYQEPENDPKNYVYLWVICSFSDLAPFVGTKRPHSAVCTLYAMNYERRDWIENLGLRYQGLLSITPRFEFYTGTSHDPAESTTTSCIFAASTVASGNPGQSGSFIIAEDEYSPVPHLSQCFLGFIEASGSEDDLNLQHYLAVFDINQWYEAHMPAELNLAEGRLCRFMGFHRLDRVPGGASEVVLSGTPVALSWSRHSSVGINDMDWYPSSLKYEAKVLTSEGLMEYICPSTQRTAMAYISCQGPAVLVNPTTAYALCKFAGLLPSENVGELVTCQSVQRETLLNVALDNNLTAMLVWCVRSFADGQFSPYGCSLQMLLDWAWNNVFKIKHHNDEISSEFLFHPEKQMVSYEIVSALHQNSGRLNTILHVVDAIKSNCGDISPQGKQELGGRHEVISLLVLHLDAVLWFFHSGLLSAYTSTQVEWKLVEYPKQDLKQLYFRRRQEIRKLASDTDSALLIDSLLTDEISSNVIKKFWEKECEGDSHYPPDSFPALLGVFLQPDVTPIVKHCLMQYFFMDLACLLNEEYEDVLKHLVKYPSSFSVPPSVIKVTQGFWLIDHKDFQEGVNALLDPMVQSSDVKIWQHRHVVRSLLLEGEPNLALQYTQVHPLPRESKKDLVLHLNLLLANGLVREAFHFQRSCLKGSTELAAHLFSGCERLGRLDALLHFPLSQDEEMQLTSQLKVSSNASALDFLLIYFLRRGRFEEAAALQQCPRAIGIANAKKQNTRSTLLQAYLSHLPEVSQKAGRDKAAEKPIRSTYNKPQPLYATIRQCANLTPKTRSRAIAEEKLTTIKHWQNQAETRAKEPMTPFRTRVQIRQDVGQDFSSTMLSVTNAASESRRRAFEHEDDSSISSLTSKRFKVGESMLSTGKNKSVELQKENRVETQNKMSPINFSKISEEWMSLLQTPKLLHVNKANRSSILDSPLPGTPHSILKGRKVSSLVSTPESAIKCSDASSSSHKFSFSMEKSSSLDREASIETPKHLRFRLPVRHDAARESETTELAMPFDTTMKDATFFHVSGQWDRYASRRGKDLSIQTVSLEATKYGGFVDVDEELEAVLPVNEISNISAETSVNEQYFSFTVDEEELTEKADDEGMHIERKNNNSVCEKIPENNLIRCESSSEGSENVQDVVAALVTDAENQDFVVETKNKHHDAALEKGSVAFVTEDQDVESGSARCVSVDDEKVLEKPICKSNDEDEVSYIKSQSGNEVEMVNAECLRDERRNKAICDEDVKPGMETVAVSPAEKIYGDGVDMEGFEGDVWGEVFGIVAQPVVMKQHRVSPVEMGEMEVSGTCSDDEESVDDVTEELEKNLLPAEDNLADVQKNAPESVHVIVPESDENVPTEQSGFISKFAQDSFMSVSDSKYVREVAEREHNEGEFDMSEKQDSGEQCESVESDSAEVTAPDNQSVKFSRNDLSVSEYIIPVKISSCESKEEMQEVVKLNRITVGGKTDCESSIEQNRFISFHDRRSMNVSTHIQPLILSDSENEEDDSEKETFQNISPAELSPCVLEGKLQNRFLSFHDRRSMNVSTHIKPLILSDSENEEGDSVKENRQTISPAKLSHCVSEGKLQNRLLSFHDRRSMNVSTHIQPLILSDSENEEGDSVKETRQTISPAKLSHCVSEGKLQNRLLSFHDRRSMNVSTYIQPLVLSDSENEEYDSENEAKQNISPVELSQCVSEEKLQEEMKTSKISSRRKKESVTTIEQKRFISFYDRRSMNVSTHIQPLVLSDSENEESWENASGREIKQNISEKSGFKNIFDSVLEANAIDFKETESGKSIENEQNTMQEMDGSEKNMDLLSDNICLTADESKLTDEEFMRCFFKTDIRSEKSVSETNDDSLMDLETPIAAPDKFGQKQASEFHEVASVNIDRSVSKDDARSSEDFSQLVVYGSLPLEAGRLTAGGCILIADNTNANVFTDVEKLQPAQNKVGEIEVPIMNEGELELISEGEIDPTGNENLEFGNEESDTSDDPIIQQMHDGEIELSSEGEFGIGEENYPPSDDEIRSESDEDLEQIGDIVPVCPPVEFNCGRIKGFESPAIVSIKSYVKNVFGHFDVDNVDANYKKQNVETSILELEPSAIDHTVANLSQTFCKNNVGNISTVLMEDDHKQQESPIPVIPNFITEEISPPKPSSTPIAPATPRRNRRTSQTETTPVRRSRRLSGSSPSVIETVTISSVRKRCTLSEFVASGASTSPEAVGDKSPSLHTSLVASNRQRHSSTDNSHVPATALTPRRRSARLSGSQECLGVIVEEGGLGLTVSTPATRSFVTPRKLVCSVNEQDSSTPGENKRITPTRGHGINRSMTESLYVIPEDEDGLKMSAMEETKSSALETTEVNIRKSLLEKLTHHSRLSSWFNSSSTTTRSRRSVIESTTIASSRGSVQSVVLRSGAADSDVETPEPVAKIIRGRRPIREETVYILSPVGDADQSDVSVFPLTDEELQDEGRISDFNASMVFSPDLPLNLLPVDPVLAASTRGTFLSRLRSGSTRAVRARKSTLLKVDIHVGTALDTPEFTMKKRRQTHHEFGNKKRRTNSNEEIEPSTSSHRSSLPARKKGRPSKASMASSLEENTKSNMDKK